MSEYLGFVRERGCYAQSQGLPLHCGPSGWLCTGQQQAAASPSGCDVNGTPAHVHTRACLWVCLYVHLSVYVHVCL